MGSKCATHYQEVVFLVSGRLLPEKNEMVHSLYDFIKEFRLGTFEYVGKLTPGTTSLSGSVDKKRHLVAL